MASKKLLTDITTATAGALLSTVLQITYNPEIIKPPLAFLDIAITLVPAFVSGALFGWLFGIAISLRNTASELEQKLNQTTGQLRGINKDFLESIQGFFKRDPFSMMLVTTPHSGVLGTLIKDSLSSGYKKIHNVDENKYLIYLQEAISYATSYLGIQRHSIRWFKNKTGQKYLESLRECNMTKKRRIFVISENEKKEMEEDLENDELLDFYWKTTGNTVETFWVREDELKKIYGFDSSINDCAFYDDQLLIMYDSASKTLDFDVMTDRPEVILFQKLNEQLFAGETTPFKALLPNENTE